MGDAIRPARAADALDAVIESIAALRGELERRFPAVGAAEQAAAPPVDRLPRAASWLERVSGIDPARWIDDLRRRLPWPGPADVSFEVDPFGLDARYLERSRPLLDFLFERWWRVVVSDAERIPTAPRVLFVANCSGVLPWDGLMLAHAVERAQAGHRRPRFLVSDHVMDRPFLPQILARLGGVRAHPENSDRLLAAGEWVIAFPEGRRGALKSFDQRYSLQRFGRGEFVSLALRRRAALVPVAIVGAEETHPRIARWEILERLFGLDLPVTPTFPWLGPLGLVPLPSQWRIRFGVPLDLAGADPSLADDFGFVARTREEVRRTVRALLAEELERRYSVWS